MNPKAIEYVGPAIAGRRTSLRYALESSGVSFQIGRDVYRTVLLSEPLELGVSKHRSSAFYDVGERSSLEPWIVAEIDRLYNANGIIFVVDSQNARRDACLSSFKRFRADMDQLGKNAEDIPTVFQINKRDCSDICSIEWVRANLHATRSAYVESIASKGVGVLESISALLNLIDTAI